IVVQPVQLKMANPFSRMAETYETIFPAMRLFAADAVSLAPPITKKSVVHDNGCGPGIVTAEILSRHQRRASIDHQPRKPPLQQTWQQRRRHFQSQGHHQPSHPPEAPHIEATDISPVMVSAAARRGATVRSQAMDSRELLGFDDAIFTHSFSNFVVLGMSEADTARVVSEMRRTLKLGGVAILTAWRALGYLDVFEQVALQIAAGSEAKSNISSNHDRSPPPTHASIDTREAVLTERQLLLALERGGFAMGNKAPGPVELRSITRVLPWALWTNEAYTPIRRSMCDGYTRGWSRADTDRLDAAFAERVAHLAKEGASYSVTAWVAIMKKV
ncbi:hypothetical protein RB596_004249, partial [Gaeumannomyces avenae]